jgi:hypothetical protein
MKQQIQRNETKVQIIKYLNAVKKISFQYFGNAKIKDFEQEFTRDYSWNQISMSLGRKVMDSGFSLSTVDKDGHNISSSRIHSKGDLLWIIKQEIDLDIDNIQSFIAEEYCKEDLLEYVNDFKAKKELLDLVDKNGQKLLD